MQVLYVLLDYRFSRYTIFPKLCREVKTSRVRLCPIWGEDEWFSGVGWLQISPLPCQELEVNFLVHKPSKAITCILLGGEPKISHFLLCTFLQKLLKNLVISLILFNSLAGEKSHHSLNVNKKPLILCWTPPQLLRVGENVCRQILIKCNTLFTAQIPVTDWFCEQVRLWLLLGPILPHNLQGKLSLTRVKSAATCRLDDM